MAEAEMSLQERRLAEMGIRKQGERDKSLLVNKLLPSLVNLSEDPQLSEVLLYVLKAGVTTVGRSGGGDEPLHDIELSGPLIMRNHCTLVNKDGVVTLDPSSEQDSQIFVNGTAITGPTVLHNADRVVAGGEYFFRFNNPLEAEGGPDTDRKASFEFARNEFIKAQTERLEEELERQRLENRERMISELQELKAEAQVEMDKQRKRYEIQLQTLEEKIEEQSLEVSMQLKTVENMKSKIEKLVKKNQLLEEETVAQKHTIHLITVKNVKEYEEVTAKRTQIVSTLKQEKSKLHEDIQKLQEPLDPASESSVLERGAELIRITTMLQEASDICKGLNRPLTFSRDDVTNETGELEFRVCVTNTSQGLMTYWDFANFEARLDKMRDIYHSNPVAYSSTPLESNSSSLSEESDPFNDPSGVWVTGTLVTPLKSPASVQIISTDATGSPAKIAALYQASQSIPQSCYENIRHYLNFSEVGDTPVSACQKMIQCVCHMRTASLALEEKVEATHELSSHIVPFSETNHTRLHTLSLYTTLELMFEVARSMFQRAHFHQVVLRSSRDPLLSGRSLLEETCMQLKMALSHQIALYCSKLLQGIESVAEDSIRKSSRMLHERLNNVTLLTGQFSLGRRVQEKAIYLRLNPSTEKSSKPIGLTENELFLSLRSYQSSALVYFQGQCKWCVLSFERAAHNCQELLKMHKASSLSLQPTALEAVLMDGVGKVVTTVLLFLQRLAGMQAEIWSLDDREYEVGTLPLTPNVNHVIDMLIHLEEVDSSTQTLCSQGLKHAHKIRDEGVHRVCVEQLSHSNGSVTLSCNELAALVLSVLNSSSQCASAQAFIKETQSLLHEVARAGKTLNHLLKSGLCTTPPHPRVAQLAPSHQSTSQATMIDDDSNVV